MPAIGLNHLCAFCLIFLKFFSILLYFYRAICTTLCKLSAVLRLPVVRLSVSLSVTFGVSGNSFSSMLMGRIARSSWRYSTAFFLVYL